MIPVITDIEEMRLWAKSKRLEGAGLGLVPTMGFLHKGHLSLVELALKKADYVVVSIFVNPTQFGPGEDFNRYPRDLEEDAKKLEFMGAHVIFAPESAAMYPAGYSTYVAVDGVTEGLCGRSRPGHFRGVTTVVYKLFNIVMPDMAVFGQKDAQQLAVIRRMVRDLNMDIEIDAGPIIRENDGLAMSSRNRYLTEEERKQSAVLYRSLCAAEKLVKSGITNSHDIIKKVKEVIEKVPLAKIEYVEIVDIDDIKPVNDVSGGALLAVAVCFGTTRLIDNMILAN